MFEELFTGGRTVTTDKRSYEQQIALLKGQLEKADAVVIGAGAGLSTSAGFTYGGKRFQKYFRDFHERYGIRDMYSGGFYPFERPEIFWAWWSRAIYFNRYVEIPSDVYDNLHRLVLDKDYFVLTTNVDHCFQKSGFDKKRLFYTQGDYGLFQTEDGRNGKTYDNEEWVEKAMEAQGFVRGEDGFFHVPGDQQLKMEIPTDLIPKSPDDGSPLTTNLRVDSNFVEDEGWHRAAERYEDFLRRHQNLHVLYLELGVGMNTPVIIKFPFWQNTLKNKNAFYVCVNYGEAACSEAIVDRSVCMDADIARVLRDLQA
jgi:NAD-dependent SIR2 family protein deacetylase